MKAERDDADRRFEPKRQYRDVGPPVAEPDFRPRSCGNAEETLAAAFLKMGADYGRPLPADFVLHAVLTPEA
jgi:hypothetical protein